MTSSEFHPRHPLFDPPPQKRLTREMVGGLAVALLIHAGLAAYIINERFEIKEVAAPTPVGIFEAPMVRLEKKPPPPTAQPEVKQTPVALHTPTQVTVLAPEPITAEPGPVTDALPTTLPLTIVKNGPDPTTPIGTGTTGPVYVKAVWSRFPDSEVMMQYYPARAQDAEVEGSSLLACTVADVKGRVRCEILSETPKGYGFGDAAVRAVESKGRADTSAGAVEVGAVMRVKMAWTLN